MKDKYSELFINALKNNDIELLKTIPKGEYHNHSALGSSRENLKKVGIEIKEKLNINSIEQMNKFSKKYVSCLTKIEESVSLKRSSLSGKYLPISPKANAPNIASMRA